MCCGNQRQQISTKSRPANSPVPPSRAAAAVGAPIQSQPRGAVAFEYRGNTALTVVSPVTVLGNYSIAFTV